MNQNKKRILTLVAFGAMVFSTISFTQAYFTDRQVVTNTFEVGSVDIELEEPSFEAVENAIPTKIYDKDPQIVNTGENGAFVYLEVKIPTANVITSDSDGTKLASQELELFNIVDLNTTKWEQIGTKSVEDGITTYVYGYKNKLAVNETTDPLFTQIQFANLIEGQMIDTTTIEENSLNVEVKAMAIQAEETGTMLEAYEKYIKQNQA